MELKGYVRVHEGALQADGSVSLGQLVMSARDRGDALRYAQRSTKKCLVLVGPYGGRLIYTKSNEGVHKSNIQANNQESTDGQSA